MTTSGEIEATMRKFDKLFERRPDLRNHRSTRDDQLWIAMAYLDGLLSIHPVRIPVEFGIAADAKWNLTGKRSESAEHQIMKHAAYLWMRHQGAADAEMEVWGVYGGRPDVYSRKARWIVECGNTPIDKVREAALDPDPQRFTLIPFQGGANLVFANASQQPTGLLALDIRWSPELRIEIERDELEEALSCPMTFDWGRPPRASRSAVPA